MPKPQYPPIYDVTKTYGDNVAEGPNKDYRATIRSQKPSETYSLLGYTVNAPFGSAACPTGADSSYIKTMFDAGYDIVTSKTRRSVYYKPNGYPNVVYIVPGTLTKDDNFQALPDRKTASSCDYETLTLANSYGNNSLDPKYWVPDARKANQYAKQGQLLITSIVGTIQDGFSTDDYYKDFATTAKLAKEAGAPAIEINFSCPNVVGEGVLCYDKSAVAAIAILVKQAVGHIPVVAKIGYFPESETGLLHEIMVAIDPYIAAISAVNTFAAPIYGTDGKQALPGEGRLKAGLSGHAIKELGVDMTRRLHALRTEAGLHYEIIGIGGVLTAADFQQYRDAGADAVLSASGAMWNPNLAHEIKNSLR